MIDRHGHFSEIERETLRNEQLEHENHQLRAENERLIQALSKIADWYGAWGPFPERNEGWRAMALVTAREAVGKPCAEEGEK